MREEFARLAPIDAVQGGRMRGLASILFALAFLAVPFSAIANRGLVPLTMVLALLGLVAQLGGRWGVRHRVAPLLPFAAVLVWGALSTVWSLDPEISLQRWVKLVGHFLLGAVLLAAVNQGLSTNAVRAWANRVALWGGVGALAVLAAHALTGGVFLVVLGLRAPHPDPQIMRAATNPAATVIVVFAAPVALLLYRRYGAPAMLTALTVTAGVVVPFSESLAAKVGLGMALAVGVLVLWRGRRTLRWLALMFIAFMLLLPALRLIDTAPFSLLRTAAADYSLPLPGAVLHRTYIYDFVLGRIAERPLLGWGLGTSRVLPGGRDHVPDPNLNNHEFLPLHPHNGVLEVWVELGAVGILGLATIVWLVLTAIRRRAADLGTAAALAAAATAYMTIGLFAYSIWSSWWIATGILVAATAIGMLHLPLNARGCTIPRTSLERSTGPRPQS